MLAFLTSITLSSVVVVQSQLELRDDVISVLVKALDDEVQQVRISAAEALGMIGPDTLPSLMKAAPHTKYAAVASAIGNVGAEALPTLSAALISDDARVRKVAVEAIGKIGPDAMEAVPVISREAHKGDSRELVELARQTLAKISPSARRALIDSLSSEELHQLLADGRLLDMIGPGDQDLIPLLTKEITSTDRDFEMRGIRRTALVKALGRIGPTALPTLVQLAIHGNQIALTVLVNSYSDHSATLKVLISALRNKNEFAVQALGNIGSRAKAAVPALARELRDNSNAQLLRDRLGNYRHTVAEALGKIGPEATTTLVEGLRGNDPIVRRWSALALARIRPVAQSTVRTLTTALSDEDNFVRSSTAEALGQIGPDAATALPALLEALRDERADVRSVAAVALGKVAPEDRSTASVLVELNDSDAIVRRLTVEALGNFKEFSDIVVPTLQKALGDEKSFVRSSAAEALGRLGTGAATAVPALITAMNDEDSQVRSSAAEALGLMHLDG